MPHQNKFTPLQVAPHKGTHFLLSCCFKKNAFFIFFKISQKIFQFCSDLQIKVPNDYLEHYPPKEKMLRTVIWYNFKVRAQFKNFLRLSHLQKFLQKMRRHKNEKYFQRQAVPYKGTLFLQSCFLKMPFSLLQNICDAAAAAAAVALAFFHKI